MTSDSPALGLRQASLSLVTYDIRWPELFAREAVLISQALPDVPFEIDHIGSTSVPGLAAKPILDIAMRSRHEDRIAPALVKLGYIDRGLRSGRLFIRLRDGNIRTHNLHLYHSNDTDCLDQIAFRDALRSNQALRDRYAALKQELVEELGDEGRAVYADRKTEFVKTAIEAHRN
ncbi:MAG: GrpB family protein [Pseudomonadota bacterium]